MTTLLVSHGCNTVFGPELAAMAQTEGIALESLVLATDREARLPDLLRGAQGGVAPVAACLRSRRRSPGLRRDARARRAAG